MFTSSLFRWLILPATGLLVCTTSLVAQKAADSAPPVKFGVITPDQFTASLPDSTAEAVILYDYGEVGFDYNAADLWINVKRHTRIKIFRKSAYDRATIALSIRLGRSGQHEFVSGFEGYTYNLVNGNMSIDPLGKAGHFTEKASDRYWIEKYTLPNVREGSIIDYQYTIRTPFSVNYNPRTWRFQHDVPVSWSEYRITIPDYFYYKILMGGYLNLFQDEYKATNINLLPGYNSVGGTAYRFVVKDAPAFRDEAYITTDDDYVSRIDFELASYQLPNGMRENISVDWEAMDQTLLTEPTFGGQFKRAPFLRETAKTLLSEHTDSLSRITAAYDFVRQQIKWNQEMSMTSNSIKKVVDDKKGDSGDINLLLIALLREMNMEANPVILSTRSHGRIDQTYALLRKFNYVVAQVSVGGKDMLLDATDVHLRPGMLPLHCLNGTGRLVHPTKSRFVSLAPADLDVEAYTGIFTLSEAGEVAGSLVHSHGGYSAWSARRQLATDGQTSYFANIRKKNAGMQLEQATCTGTDGSDKAFTVSYSLTVPEACSKVGERLYFRPMLAGTHTTNPFKENERLYPVDFGVAIDETYSATYTLPDGFQVEELPKPASIALPENGGRFLYRAVVNGNQLQVTSRISLRKTMYFAHEYLALRELFSQIVAKQAEQVVLKRGAVAEKK